VSVKSLDECSDLISWSATYTNAQQRIYDEIYAIGEVIMYRFDRTS
jgi:hypothetical protein